MKTVQCYNGRCGDEGDCSLGDDCPVREDEARYWTAYFERAVPCVDLTQEQRAELRAWDRGLARDPEWL